MPLKALLFGSLSVMADTSERQRSAYNAAFREAGLNWSWDRNAYRDMLMINGGKKRLRHYAEITDANLSDAQAAEVQAYKTRIFDERMKAEGIKLRPGIERLVSEAKGAGLKIGFVSATSRDNIEALAEASGGALDLDTFDIVTDGSLVETRKPDPAIYKLALDKLGVTADEALAIEDTATSAKSALDAGIVTLGLPNANAEEQQWNDVKAVMTSLGNEEEKASASRSPIDVPDLVDTTWLRKLLDA